MAAAALAPAGARPRRPPAAVRASPSAPAPTRPIRSRIWDAILAYRPELFIFAGDNVYGDFNTADATNLREPTRSAEDIAGLQQAARQREPPRRLGTITTTA